MSFKSYKKISYTAFQVICLAICLMSYRYIDRIVAYNDCAIENTCFEAGEKIIYKVFYNLGLVWIPAGEVSFTVTEDEKNYIYKARGKSYKSYDSFFKVDDYYYSRVNKKTLFPYEFVRSVEEGNYFVYDSILFDQKTNIAISHYGKTADDTKQYAYSLGTCMQDLLSNIYFMRNLDTRNMKKGDIIPIKMFFDKEIYPLKVVFQKKEEKKIKDLGKFKTVQIIPSLIAGNVFKEGDQMKIWVSDDSNKLPLLIESPIAVGSVKIVLKSYKNLKYPLSSEIVK